MQERRQHKRITKPFDGSWNGASGAAPCRIGDVSLGGCYVHTRAVPAVGEETTVTIAIGSHQFSFRGHVVHTDPGMGFGVRFVGISASDYERLAQLLDAIEPGLLEGGTS